MDFFGLNLMFDLTIHRSEDRGGDEPRLQFAFVTRHRGRTQVDIRDSGQLASDFAAGRGGTRTLRGRSVTSHGLPSEREPFLGIVARAIENDSSRGSDRQRDTQALQRAVHNGADAVFRRGAVPTATDLWRAAHAVQLIDRTFRDDDDRIGVSARAYPDFGLNIRGEGEVLENDVFGLVEDGANWTLNWRMRAAELI